jgi:hypothetical protein
MSHGQILQARSESFADYVLPPAVLAGAVLGALAAAALGAEAETAFSHLCGMVGTMLGTGLVVGGWFLVAHLRADRPARRRSHHTITEGGEPGALSVLPGAGGGW